MKHNEQSQQTKQALSEALKAMMKKKPLNKITVRELVEDCGVNRKTFYYHFEDIFSLLKWTLDQEAMCMFGKYDLVSQRREAVDFALDYISSNHDILHNIVHSIGRSELSRYFYNDIYEPSTQSGPRGGKEAFRDGGGQLSGILEPFPDRSYRRNTSGLHRA